MKNDFLKSFFRFFSYESKENLSHDHIDDWNCSMVIQVGYISTRCGYTYSLFLLVSCIAEASFHARGFHMPYCRAEVLPAKVLIGG